MAGIFPAISLSGTSWSDRSGFHRAMTASRSDTGGKHPQAAQILFIIFVDAMFTTSIERLFTKVFEAVARTAAFACVYRACNHD